MITFDTTPEKYNHWKLSIEPPVATLTLDIQEDKGLFPTYKLKLNSYDLGVDIELNDALNRIRFEHPEVKSVVVTSGKPRMFCSGANIYMLGQSTHAWKVNFCKFTNETRNGIEDSSRHSGLKFLAALNGATAGGGYEMALACDEIAMIDDRSSAVSLPEVPLLGVLPGTGGLTRLVDKRKMRRDLADVFCTTSEGVRADRAKEWRLVDHVAKPQGFTEMVKARALEMAKKSDRPEGAKGVALTPLKRTIDDKGYHYVHVDVTIDRTARNATITVKGPQGAQPGTIEAVLAQGDQWWPLAMARELDDAVLLLRTNDAEVGTWVLKTEGSVEAALAADKVLAANEKNWFVRETLGFIRRTFSRIDVASRSLIALVDTGSCFAGTLAELALAADRSYMLAIPDDAAASKTSAPKIALSALNFGPYEMANHRTRIATRFCDEETPIERCRSAIGEPLDADAARELGLVTITPDELDWTDEIRLAIEERASQSPDALTAMEASLRFAGAETMETRIFGRLTAWQNWVFNRPNAVGEQGALKVYGTGSKAKFNWERV